MAKKSQKKVASKSSAALIRPLIKELLNITTQDKKPTQKIIQLSDAIANRIGRLLLVFLGNILFTNNNF